jgi:hypothetical protein
MAGFFLWLESIQPSVGAELTRDLLDAFPAVSAPETVEVVERGML